MEDFPSDNLEQTVDTAWAMRVDDIAGFDQLRDELFVYAEAIRSEREAIYEQAGEEAVPRGVDPFSTAQRYAVLRDTLGAESPEAQTAWHALVRDTERLYGEAYRRKGYEDFDEFEHDYVDGDFIAEGRSTNDMVTLGGITAIEEAEEADRRVNEFVEQAIDVILHEQGEVDGVPIEDLIVFEISECADWAIRKWQDDQLTGKKGSYGGYVPEIEKFAIRTYRHDREAGKRYQGQTLIPGTLIDHDTIIEMLQEHGFLAEGEMPDKTQLHGMQFIAHKDHFASRLDIAQALDETAGRRKQANIFMGEQQPSDAANDYASVPRQAAERLAQNQENIHDLSAYIVKLVDMEVGYEQGYVRLVGYLNNQLHAAARDNYDIAEMIFDRDTADGYMEVRYLEEMGLLDQAFAREQEVVDKAPMPSFCGAGSCGLDQLLPQEVAEAEAIGMRAFKKDETDSSFLRLKGAKCGSCKSSRTVIGSGQKGCLDCKTVVDTTSGFMSSKEQEKKEVGHTLHVVKNNEEGGEQKPKKVVHSNHVQSPQAA